MEPKKEKKVVLGNVAIARGIVEAGCHVVASYPGTPSSEILPAVVGFKKTLDLNIYTEWSANEKVAFDVALAASWTGKRSAVAMKQVGLNVAADSLMSSAYTGIIGGMVIISCDDPGPHSSQTEQDSRHFALFAKLPVYDPSTPQEAKEMVKEAFELSEAFEIPVLVRPTIRVSHGLQSVDFSPLMKMDRQADFKKDPARWAATPGFRLILHTQLNEKIERIREKFESDNRWNTESGPAGPAPLGLVTCSASFAFVSDLLQDLDLNEILPVLKIGTPFPFPQGKVSDFIRKHDKILIVEETDTVIESQIVDKSRVLGRLTGHVPLQGELTPEKIHGILANVFEEIGRPHLKKPELSKISVLIEKLDLPARKPTLCAGCPERAAFYAIKKALPKALYPSDIGCYTLGLNLKAVDTVLDMGAGITLASGFSQAYLQDGKDIPIVATMGDSTFYHSGTSSLLSAVYNGARFILVVLDNEITAMTGMQPTPGIGTRADGSEGVRVPLEGLIRGCGAEWIRTVDPYDVQTMIGLLKEARAYTQKEDGGIAVIIARHPCLIQCPGLVEDHPKPVEITSDCNGCNYCLDYFECPALLAVEGEKRVEIDRAYCVDCGVCVHACPKGAIVPAE